MRLKISLLGILMIFLAATLAPFARAQTKPAEDRSALLIMIRKRHLEDFSEIITG